MGYIIIWVQVDGVQGYDEDQIALVIPDLSDFAAQVPVIWGNPYSKLCHEHDKGKGDRCPGYTLGKCLGGLPFGSSVSYSHSGRQ